MRAASRRAASSGATGADGIECSIFPFVSAAYPARVLDLGRAPFDEVWALQLDLVARRQRDEIADTLVLVEHPEVLTLGRGGKQENVLAGAVAAGVPTFAVERG